MINGFSFEVNTNLRRYHETSHQAVFINGIIRGFCKCNYQNYDTFKLYFKNLNFDHSIDNFQIYLLSMSRAFTRLREEPAFSVTYNGRSFAMKHLKIIFQYCFRLNFDDIFNFMNPFCKFECVIKVFLNYSKQ